MRDGVSSEGREYNDRQGFPRWAESFNERQCFVGRQRVSMRDRVSSEGREYQ
jgi:hypothetical protein